MRCQAGFGNCNDVAAADGPGQRNRGRRTTVCCADGCKRSVMQQAGAAERSIVSAPISVMPLAGYAFMASSSSGATGKYNSAPVFSWMTYNSPFWMSCLRIRTTSPARCPVNNNRLDRTGHLSSNCFNSPSVQVWWVPDLKDTRAEWARACPPAETHCEYHPCHQGSLKR
jgi:hypothetical protein